MILSVVAKKRNDLRKREGLMFNLLDLNRSLKQNQLSQVNLMFICLALCSLVAAGQDGTAKNLQSARRVIFEDRDWRGEGAVEAGEGVEIWQTPESGIDVRSHRGPDDYMFGRVSRQALRGFLYESLCDGYRFNPRL
jgi:hypothetical protein